MAAEFDKIRAGTARAAAELLAAAKIPPGGILVVGCSTSEILGEQIGSSGSEAVAEAVFSPLKAAADAAGIFLAVQCCEHLNRALVLEHEAVTLHRLEEVSVVPVPRAGGALAALAMRRMRRPAVVSAVQAHAGLDIGLTLIGMHLRPVAVPVRLSLNTVGRATIVAARTRPRLVGGARAVYEIPAGDDCRD